MDTSGKYEYLSSDLHNTSCEVVGANNMGRKEDTLTSELRSHQTARDRNASFVIHLQLDPRRTVAIRLERRLKSSLAPFLVTAIRCNCQSHLLVM